MIYFQLLYCMIAIIVVPAVLSSLLLAIRDPGIVFGEKENKEGSKNRGIVTDAPTLTVRILDIGKRTLIVLMSFFNPLLILDQKETIKEKLNQMMKLTLTEVNVAEIRQKLSRLIVIKQEYATFLRVELGLETFYQLFVQVSEGEFQIIFWKERKFYSRPSSAVQIQHQQLKLIF